MHIRVFCGSKLTAGLIVADNIDDLFNLLETTP